MTRRVTRTEVVEELGGVFSGSGASRRDLIAEARRRSARPQLMQLLERLPDRRYRHIRDLWTEAPEVPLDD